MANSPQEKSSRVTSTIDDLEKSSYSRGEKEEESAEKEGESAGLPFVHRLAELLSSSFLRINEQTCPNQVFKPRQFGHRRLIKKPR